MLWEKSNDYMVLAGITKNPIKAWINGVPLEGEAEQQLINVANMPFIHKHVAVMPDVHWGRGATIGSVIPTIGAIIPAAVGVDIGCGMMACRLNLKAHELPDNLYKIRSDIEKAIPHGRTDNGGHNDRGAWGEPPSLLTAAWSQLMSLQDDGRLDDIPDRYITRAVHHLGTLGTGNHFIELCLDEHDDVWIMLHSGSRGIGNVIGRYYIDRAKEDMKRYYINLPDADLAYIPEGASYFNAYVKAVSWAQDFARANRQIMMILATEAVGFSFEGKKAVEADMTNKAIECHHNYIAKENHFGQNIWVTRKGAVRAREGDLGIIPGSMGAKSYIVRGKGNADSFMSCSHGTGRQMSRAKAKATFTLEDHAKATLGVECRKDAEVIDETPGAYKDIDKVMQAQANLVDIVHTLRQIVCVKG